jgi:tetratricopeptide (TPR) repeat protein
MAINAFLVRDLLAAATPDGAQGDRVGVADVLANASRSVAYAFAGQPATEAEVRTTLAESYLSLGQIAEARTHAEAARHLWEGASPPDPLAVLRARALVTRVLAEEGRYAEARREAEAVIDAQAVTAGAAHRDTIATRILLAWTLRETGEVARAEQTARAAVADALSQYPDDWRLGSEARSRLVEVLVAFNQGLEADGLAAETVRVLQRHLGPTHPDVLAAMSLRGSTLNALLKFEDALSLRRELLNVHEHVYGPRHPRTAQARSTLATAHDRLGHRVESREQAELAHEIFAETLGPDHPETLVALENVGIATRRAFGAERARPIYRRVLDTRRRALGSTDEATIRAAVRWANLHADLPGRLGEHRAAAEAIGLCDEVAASPDTNPASLGQCAAFLLDAEPADLRNPQRARHLAERAAAVDNRADYLRLRTLARAQKTLGDWQGAMATLRDALALPQAIQSWTTEEDYVALLIEHASPAELETWLLGRLRDWVRLRGPDDRFMAKTERHLASLYARTNRPAEAEARFAAVLAQLSKSVPPTDWELGRAMSELGERLVLRQAFAEAEPLLIDGFASLTADARAGRISRADARDRVVRLYEAWGRSADAERWRRQSLVPDPATGPGR